MKILPLCLSLAWSLPLCAQVPSELFDVVRVVDGDTIHIERDGKLEKLRLLSVDTEEKISNFSGGSASKPATVFGEECALWAQEFFARLAEDGKPARIGLAFPGGLEKRGGYGRLLCHVILPDGRDFNLRLVELGKSPYFDKYGADEICHEAFVAAEESARKQQLGIWNPATNRPETPGAPAARRPYERLLPWWQARSDAIDAFRARNRDDPGHVIDAAWPASLETGARTGAKDEEVEVFGEINRFFDEDDGDWTILFHTSDSERALRVRIAAEHRPAFADLELERFKDKFRQNYVYVRGKLTESARGFTLRCKDPKAFRAGGPEPVMPVPAAVDR